MSEFILLCVLVWLVWLVSNSIDNTNDLLKKNNELLEQLLDLLSDE